MDFLGLLKDIISIVVIANAATGNLKNQDESYVKALTDILTADDGKH